MTEQAFVRELPDVHDEGAGVPAFPAGTSERAITAASPGYGYFTDYKGNRWLCCDCVNTFLTLAQRLAIKKGMIKQGLDVWQLTGSAAASAGTHTQGGAFDLLLQTSDAWVKFFRDLGATATWRRTTAQGFAKVHLHGVLNGCPHNSPARYQVTEQKSGPPAGGGDGLTGTKPDYHPDPNPYRTWTQGVQEMKRLLGDLAVSPATSLVIAPQSNIKGGFSLLTARTPTLVAGTHVYEYETTAKTWAPFKSIVPVKGASSTYWSFGGTHRVRVRYVPKDPLQAKPSTSAPLQVRTYDLAAQTALAAQVPGLKTLTAEQQQQIATLKARIAELEAKQEPDPPAPSVPVPALGVDVAGYQTVAQIKALPADVQFIIVKATEGLTYDSPLYVQQTLAAAGRLTGSYHFAWPEQDVVKEAQHYLQTAKPASGQIVALDLEHDGASTWPARVAYALAWLRYVENATGAIPLVYVNWTWIKGLRSAATVAEWEELTTFPLWLAEWTKTPGQHSSVDAKPGSSSQWDVLIHQYDVIDNIDRNWTPDLNALRSIAVR